MNRPQPDRRWRSLPVLTAWLAAFAAPLAVAQAPNPPSEPTPWIEQRAPDAFAGGRPSLYRVDAAYRMDATIVIPMLFTSMPIWSTSGVGTAHVFAAGYALDPQRTLQAYEFFATSFPERARGVTRLGMFREVQEFTSGEPMRTTYFGTMSLSPEATLAEAEESAKTSQSSLTYEMLDGTVTTNEEVSAVYRMVGPAEQAGPETLYAQAREGLSEKPRSTGKLSRTSTPLPTQSFLAALHASFEDLTSRGAALPKLRLPHRTMFSYNSLPRYLDLIGLQHDPKTGRQHTPASVVRNAEAVYKLTYRLSRPNRRATTDFTVWIELDAGRPASAGPAVPLAFYVQPRSFLRLRFERTS